MATGKLQGIMSALRADGQAARTGSGESTSEGSGASPRTPWSRALRLFTESLAIPYLGSATFQGRGRYSADRDQLNPTTPIRGPSLIWPVMEM